MTPLPQGMGQRPPGFVDPRSSSTRSAAQGSGAGAAAAGAAAGGHVLSLAELEASLLAGGGGGGGEQLGGHGRQGDAPQQGSSNRAQVSRQDEETFNHMALLLGRLGEQGNGELQQRDASQGGLQVGAEGQASMAGDEQQRAAQHLMGLLQFSSQGGGVTPAPGMQPLPQQPLMMPLGLPPGIPPQHLQAGGRYETDAMFVPPIPKGQPQQDGAILHQYPFSSPHMPPPPYRYASDVPPSTILPPHLRSNPSYSGLH